MTQPQPLPLTVTLWDSPKYPRGSLYCVWQQSRHNRPLPHPREIEAILNYDENNKVGPPTSDTAKACGLLGFPLGATDGNYNTVEPTYMWKPEDLLQLSKCAQHIMDEVHMVLHESIPVSENINFTFLLQNIPITLREQLVRHRIGTQINPRVGADIAPMSAGDGMTDLLEFFAQKGWMSVGIVPDLAESTFWSQTSRVIDQGTFYDDGRWVLPDSLGGKEIPNLRMSVYDDPEKGGLPDRYRPGTAEELYRMTLLQVQDAYNKLVAAGVHIEDARNIIPVGMTHSLTWTLNLKALQHIAGKRSCWIAQAGVWEGVLGQMVAQLCEQVHPMFRYLLAPICVKKDKYTGCPIAGTNKERIQGKDHTMPPCPLYIRYERDAALGYSLSPENDEHSRHLHSWHLQDHVLQSVPADGKNHSRKDEIEDIRNWTTRDMVALEMLEKTAPKFSKLWGQDIYSPTWEKAGTK